MLLDFTVSNYRSIYDAASINMIAGREQAHRERCPLLSKRYKKTVNPIAAIFGANAAGKTTFIKAMQTLKDLIADPPRPTAPMPFDPFGLNDRAKDEPTSFELMFVWDDFIYDYILRFDDNHIVEESLSQILSKTEQRLFIRHEDQFEFPQIDSRASSLSEQVKSATTLLSSVPDKVPLASYVGEVNFGDLATQFNLSSYAAVKKFLENVFVVPAGIMELPGGETNFGYWQELITEIDAGIEGVHSEPVELQALGLRDDTLRDYRRVLTTSKNPIHVELPNGRFTISLDEDELIAERISLEHASEGSRPKRVKWSAESDGIKSAARLLGLFELYSRPDMRGVLMVDEIDRSFHTELSKALIGGFLKASNKDSRTQILLTTHDLLLMDPQLLRRDEILIVEKDHTGQTNITPLSDFEEPRKTTDLRKSYLQGRFGGIPAIQPLRFSRG